MISLSVFKSSINLLLVLLITFSLLYVYFTNIASLRPCGVTSPVDFCATPERSFETTHEKLKLEGKKLHLERFFVVLLGRGDNVTVDVIPPSAPWTYSLLIIDAITGEVIVDYSIVNYTVRFTPPLFIAPRSTIYYIRLEARVDLKENAEKACLVYNLAIYPAKREDAVNVIYAFTALLLGVLGVVVILKPTVKYSGFLGELVINAKFMWLWSFTPLAFLVIYSTLLDTSPIVPLFPDPRRDLENKLIALQNYRELVKVDFLALYGVTSIVLYALLFTYRREIGEEKLRDTLPYSRLKRYFSIILTHFILLYAPLLVVSILHLFKQVPHIAIHEPYVFLKYLQHLLVVTLFIYSVISILPLVVSILAPRTSISMLLSVVLYLLLLYETPVSATLFSLLPLFRRPIPMYRAASLGLYVNSLVGVYLYTPEDIGKYVFSWEGGIGRYIDYFAGTPLLYLALILLCLVVYVKRENP